MAAEPMKPGFYWARWVSAEQGTPYGEITSPDVEWEIVHVFQSDDELRVMIPGVSACQGLCNFEWGGFVSGERLSAPSEADGNGL